MNYRFSLLAASLLVLSAVMAPTAAVAQNDLNRGSNQDTPADGRGDRVRQLPPRAANSGAVVTGNGISYHNGPVMKGTVFVYYIWYGNWAQDPKASPILTDWASSIGGSPYMGVNTTYGDTTGNVSGAVAYGGSTADAGSFGTSLTDSNIASIVSNALSTGKLPTDSNGVYFVLTAPGVAETSGFLTQYCGWHTYGGINGANIKYSFVGDAGNNSGCSMQFSSSPNGDPPADAMVSVMAHELEEAISDPNLNAWYDSSSNENADKCAWTFGAEYTVSNGSKANMKLGARDYLIQQNWLNAGGGYCALSYTATADFSLAVSPTSQTLPSTGGTTGNYTITETPLNGFTGTVTYGVSGLPSGATAGAIIGGVFTVTAAGTAQGSYPFTITGTSGSLVHTAAATLVVSPPSTPTFTISISPTSQTVNRPGSTGYTVTLTPQNGFSADVALTASGARSGLTLGFSPTTVTGGNGPSTLTATVTNSAKKGNVTLTVTGTGGGVTKSASASLHIQ